MNLHQKKKIIIKPFSVSPMQYLTSLFSFRIRPPKTLIKQTTASGTSSNEEDGNLSRWWVYFTNYNSCQINKGKVRSNDIITVVEIVCQCSDLCGWFGLFEWWITKQMQVVGWTWTIKTSLWFILTIVKIQEWLKIHINFSVSCRENLTVDVLTLKCLGPSRHVVTC